MNNTFSFSGPEADTSKSIFCDLCVYGGTSGGLIAALAARQTGLKVVVVEAGVHLGGLTTGGLSYTDIGNKQAIGGLSREFYRRVGAKYGVDEHWRFEPHMASEVFAEWLREAEVPVLCHSPLGTVEMDGRRIKRIRTVRGVEISASMFIDTSYEGDLMAAAGVSFTVGREDNGCYQESLNGSQIMEGHQFELPVDPYRTAGVPSSGLLPGIDPEGHVTGKGDKRIQAYNFRICLTKDPENRITFEKPTGYNPENYILLKRYLEAGYVPKFDKFDAIANGKYDVNNHGAFSTDFIGGNHHYPIADFATRESIHQAHVQWVRGLFWFWYQDRSVLAAFQEPFREFGYCKDEFIEYGGFSPALYVREARRMVSDVVMTEHHCVGESVVEDSAGLAAYVMDSHNCRRLVVSGNVRNEGNVEVHPKGPYAVSYRSLVPRKGECENLLVPFCLSASHIAFGSIRMEPVFMGLSHACTLAAAIALNDGIAVQDVPYERLRKALLDARLVIDPVPKAKDIQSGS